MTDKITVTLEQAILNIKQVYELHFRGTKKEHMVIEESINRIESSCAKDKAPQDKKPPKIDKG